MKKLLAVLNMVSIVGIVAWNYLVNAQGINGNTVGSLSDEYLNLFTPAGYAFSIWGLIFLGLIALGICQLKWAWSEDVQSGIVHQMGPWLIIANVLNAIWLWVWLHELTLLSVVVMLGILVSLIVLMLKLHMGIQGASPSIRRWIWGPISLYAGWISVATIANISAYLAKVGWSEVFNEAQWTICMMLTALVLNLIVLVRRRLPVFAAVGVWALLAIAMRHWGNYDALQWVGISAAGLLAASILYLLYFASPAKINSSAA